MNLCGVVDGCGKGANMGMYAFECRSVKVYKPDPVASRIRGDVVDEKVDIGVEVRVRGIVAW